MIQFCFASQVEILRLDCIRNIKVWSLQDMIDMMISHVVLAAHHSNPQYYSFTE